MTQPPSSETPQERDDSFTQVPSRTWESPRLSYVGHVANILQGGIPGKLSPTTNDPGDIRKPPGGA